jgi:hypothetical protein
MVFASRRNFADAFHLATTTSARRPGAWGAAAAVTRGAPSTPPRRTLLRSTSSPPSKSELPPATEQDTASSRSAQLRESQMVRFLDGCDGVVTGRAMDMTKLEQFFRSSPVDVVGTVTMIPLVAEAFRTAATGEFDTSALSYQLCVASTVLGALSHAIMAVTTPRDSRAPRLAEPRTVYEFSALYLIPFAWLLWRITPVFPRSLEVLDPSLALLFTLITLYGVACPIYGLHQFAKGCDTLEPSTLDYHENAKLLCKGGIAINVLACLFIPFCWCLCFQGTEWWDRVQQLHPHEGAFFGVSILVAIVGDMSGNWLLRLKESGIVRQYSSLVALGTVSNFLLLLFPEILFNTIYHSGVSEIGFYWE